VSQLTEKQSAFARAYVECKGNASEAYRRAYDAENMSADAIKVEACRLLQRPNVALTVETLQAKHQKRHEITIDKLTEMAVAAYDLAMDEKCNAPGAAVSALLAIGKLHGLVVDKKEVTRRRDATDLSLEELYTIAGMGRARDHQADASAAEPDLIH
jgi:phage terminase small subunit